MVVVVGGFGGVGGGDGGVDGRRLCWRSGGAEGGGRPPAEAAGACGRRHHIKIMILMRDAQLKRKMRMMFGFFDDNWKK